MKIPVFDIGDTLCSSRPFSRRFFRNELEKQGVENPPEYPFAGHNEFVEGSIQSWLDEEGIDADASIMVQNYREAKKRQLEESGVLELLKKVGREIVTPGIVSDNKIKAKQVYKEVFEKHNVDINGFVVSEEVDIRKPDAGIFEAFLQDRGVKGQQCVYFGNNAAVDKGSEKVGMRFVWLTQYDTFGTDWSGDSIDELTFENVLKHCKEGEQG